MIQMAINIPIDKSHLKRSVLCILFYLAGLYTPAFVGYILKLMNPNFVFGDGGVFRILLNAGGFLTIPLIIITALLSLFKPFLERKLGVNKANNITQVLIIAITIVTSIYLGVNIKKLDEKTVLSESVLPGEKPPEATTLPSKASPVPATISGSTEPNYDVMLESGYVIIENYNQSDFFNVSKNEKVDSSNTQVGDVIQNIIRFNIFSDQFLGNTDVVLFPMAGKNFTITTLYKNGNGKSICKLKIDE